MSYGYTVEDVDNALVSYIKAQKIVLPMEGKDIRLKTILTTPEEVYAKKTIPCIAFESGYLMETPESWIVDSDVSKVIGDDTVVDTVEEIATIYYSYKIGYYVTDPRHDVYLSQMFMKMFPTKMLFEFDKELDDGIETYSLMFLRSPRVIKMDSYQDGGKIYRKDFILTTTMHFSNSYSKEFLRMKGFELSLMTQGE